VLVEMVKTAEMMEMAELMGQLARSLANSATKTRSANRKSA